MSDKKSPRRGKRKQTQLRMSKKDRAVFCALQASVQDLTQQLQMLKMALIGDPRRVSSSNITVKAPENFTPEQAQEYELAYQLGKSLGKLDLKRCRQFDR